MRFSLKYLLKFIEHLPYDVSRISEQFINLGLELESCVEEAEDSILEVAVAPNRADLLGIIGIARELALINNTRLKLPELNDDMATVVLDQNTNVSIAKIDVKVIEPESCPKYLTRVIHNIDPNKSTPIWMQQVLHNAGINLVSSVVDITNYVMLELGQPLHAFDLSKVSDGITVRKAKVNEELILLNNSKINLTTEDLIIANNQEPLAIAGIMGGLHSGITNNTKNIVLECAYFEPIGIRMTAQRHNLISDSAHRFMRNIDYDLQHIAMLRVSDLLKEINGGQFGPIISVVNEQFLPKKTVISLNREKIKTVLGMYFSDQKIIAILHGLKMDVVKNSDIGWNVTVPSWRQDLKIPEDLIEEIARFLGYNNITQQIISLPLKIKPLAKSLNFSKELTYKHCLVDRGYSEVITYSFIDPELASLFEKVENFYKLKNPISQNMSVMRSGLWPGLIAALLHNQNRQQTRVRLFELGTVFILDSKTKIVEQKKKLAGIVSGKLLTENWQHLDRDVDFFALKSDVEAVLRHNKPNAVIKFTPVIENKTLHSLQAANIFLDGVMVGNIGALHPKLIKTLSLMEPTLVFELDLTIISDLKLPRFIEISKFPFIRRDFSITVDIAITCEEIHQVVQNSCGELLKKIIFFDLYSSNKLSDNQKSIAFGVILQHKERTLEELDIHNLETNILLGFKKIGATLRA